MASKTISIEKTLLKSPAFRALSGMQKTVLFDFLMKRRLKKMPNGVWEISNNGDIEYCYSEAEKKGIGRSTFMKCIDALIAYGFIDISNSVSGGKKGDKNLYWICNRWEKWGTDSFVEKKRPKDTRCKRGFAAHPKRRKKNISTQKCNRTVTQK
jgi:hypothetical protein